MSKSRLATTIQYYDNIQKEYELRISSLSGKERVARSMALLRWTRDVIVREIRAEKDGISEEQLKWEIALRLYGSDDSMRRMIERKLADVSS